MKKHIFTILTIVITVITVSCFTAFASDAIFETPHEISVNDFSKVIQPSTKNYINNSNRVLMTEVEAKVIFAIVPTTNGEPVNEYAQRLHKSWSVPYIGDNSSVFILLATDDMEYWPIVGSHIESVLTPDIVNDYLLQYLEPDFANKDFDTAVRKTYDAFSSWYSATFNTMLSNTPNIDDDNKNSGLNIPWGTIFGVLFKILAVAAVIYLIISARIRRKKRIEQIAQRKRMRKATLAKYQNHEKEPSEQYSFSYSEIKDDNN